MISRSVKALLGWERRTKREKDVLAHRLRRAVARAISLLPVPLWVLLRAFGSDKHRPGLHGYGFTYHALFRPLKYRRIKLLEIGIGGYGTSLGGQSLLAWQAFFPFGDIVAADIAPKRELTGGRAHIRVLDQSSAEDLTVLCAADGPFDIAIDDGSHMNAHQIFTFQHLWDSVKDGGIYVVEDIQTSFWAGEVDGVHWDGAPIDDPAFSRTCAGYFLELAKYTSHAEFLDLSHADPALLAIGRTVREIAFSHNLIVIRKGANDGGSPLAKAHRAAAVANRSQ